MMIGAVYSFYYETIELCSKIVIVSQLLRQSGHIFIEGNVSDNEVAKIGFNTDMKITAITLMLLIKALDCYFNDSFETFIDFEYMFCYYIFSIFYRIVYLTLYGERVTRISVVIENYDRYFLQIYLYMDLYSVLVKQPQKLIIMYGKKEINQYNDIKLI